MGTYTSSLSLDDIVNVILADINNNQQEISNFFEFLIHKTFTVVNHIYESFFTKR